ncbi:hypothetical protein [Nocardioides nanhaiensis]|uniref:PH domain-containing protein n=1 Tax=Nocardioides nanhaiensis TaxID=1476871 RepID=A0ABP8WUR8_9ACTN
MRQRTLQTGPVRSAHGRVALHVDAEGLLLVEHASWRDDVEWVVAAPVVLAVCAFVASAYADGGAQAVLSYAAAGLLVVALVAYVALHVGATAMAARSALSRRGRSETRSHLRGLGRALRGEVDESSVLQRVPRRDVVAVPPLSGRWRPTLLLGTTVGELRISGWPWRRSDLELVRTALGGVA